MSLLYSLAPVANVLASAADDDDGVGAGVVVLLLILGIASLILWIAALVSIARAPMTGGSKILWIVLVIIFPLLGSLAWFLFGRRMSANSPTALR